MATERSVIVKIRADYAAFKRDMAAAAKAADDAAKKTEQANKKSEESGKRASSVMGRLAQDARKNGDAWETAGENMMGGGALMLSAATLSIAKYAQFDKAMSSVRASTHETKENMDLLRQAAIDAGADTAFSATEAAGAIEELAKAGVSTQDILGGGLSGALDLAAAGNLDVAKAAEISASALTQFKLSGEKVPHVADLLAAGAGKAQGSVEDLGMALNQSGLVASQTGLSIEETTGGLAAFASAGLVGSDAGTSFKTMLQALTPNSKAAAETMDSLGISAYDAQGNFIGLAGFAGQLRGALKDMSEEQRNATLETIFGSDAVRAAAVLYEQGADGVQEWIDKVNDAGYAAITASIQQDNLIGDLEKLGGALDTLLIQGGSGANGALRGLVQGAEALVDAAGKIPAPLLSAGVAIGGIAGATALGIGGFLKFTPMILESVDAFRSLGSEGSKVPGVLGRITKAAGIATIALAGLEIGKQISNALQPAGPELSDTAMKLTDLGKKANVLDGLFSDIDWGWDPTMAKDVTDLDGAVRELTSNNPGDAFGRWAADVLGLDNGFKKLNDRFTQADQIMAEMARSGAGEKAAAGFREVAEAAESQGKGLDWVAAKFPSYVATLRDSAAALGQNVKDADLFQWALTGIPPAAVAAADGARIAAGGTSELAGAAEEAKVPLEDLVQMLFQLGIINMDSRATTAAFHDSLRNAKDTVTELAEEEAALAEKGETLGAVLQKNGKDFDLTTEAGSRADAAFRDVANKGMADFEAKARQGLGQKELQENLRGTYDGLISTLAGFDITGKAAETLAREVLGVPDGVSIESWMSDTAQKTAENTGKAVVSIDGKKVTVKFSDDGTAAGVEENVGAVKRAMELVPGEKRIVIDEPMSPGVKKKLQDLGYVVTTLPNGKVEVSERGAGVTRQAVEGVGAAVDSVNGRTATVTVNHNTIYTEEHIQKFKQEGVPVGYYQRAPSAKKALGGRLDGLAGGGKLPATGLGTDKILALDPAGTPVVWLDDEEWMINGRSSNKYDRVLRMINEDAPEVQGLAGLAAGGRLTWARTQQSDALADWRRSQWWVKENTRRLKAAEKSKNKSAIKSAESNLNKIKKAEERDRDAYEAARDRTQRLIASERELKTDLRRGSIRDQVMSGSGLSVVDRMFEESRNTDLSKGQRNNLSRTAFAMEKQLLSLEKRSDKVADSLEKARERYEDLMQVRTSIGSGIRAETNLGAWIGEHEATKYGKVTAKGLAGIAQSKAGQIRNFVLKLNALRTKGYAAAIIQEVAEMGTVEGMKAADILLSGSNADRDAMNKAYKDLDFYSDQVGNSVTMAMYKGGSNAALGLIKGLESQEKAIEAQMLKIAKSAETTLRKAWGINSPAKKFVPLGSSTVEGVQLGVKQQKALLDRDMAALVDPSLVAGKTYAVPQTGFTMAALSAAAPAGPGSFTGDLYLDSGEFLGKVRGVAREESAAAINTVARKAGARRQ